jgi:phosphosulfolactate synthase
MFHSSTGGTSARTGGGRCGTRRSIAAYNLSRGAVRHASVSRARRVHTVHRRAPAPGSPRGACHIHEEEASMADETEAATRRAWAGILDFPAADREDPPRGRGLTMVIDKGIGLTGTRDLMELAGDYVDQVKLTFGTSAFYPRRLLRQKIELVKSYGVHIYPGGTFLELALLQNKLEAYLERAEELGFTGIEVSDGTITLDAATRAATIRRARAFGFELVVSEVGKKDPRDKVPDLKLWTQVEDDLAAGSDFVIVEGRESGQGVVIYDDEGHILERELEELVSHVSEPNRLMWEAPHKAQQHQLVMRFGPNVNLGNVAPDEALALEALRVGLRGDTLRQYFLTVSSEDATNARAGAPR